ncbi:hypothetical protein ACFOLJ_02185 [Rugamonas sp. CCM 8940]|uniref:hypothetical protein n=1 Tax=Rugamonas sp. CCM 8940 TaxID=2765359 RepID=UPI0018F5F542|nr:hypothetical protein [Rugamonas sp. CCM 8940]MBJ7311750.1 hypothetical protein [Rugamonas sp. CCM 8940]
MKPFNFPLHCGALCLALAATAASAADPFSVTAISAADNSFRIYQPWQYPVGGGARPASANALFAAMDREAALIERSQPGRSLSMAGDGSAIAFARRDARGMVIGFGAGGMGEKFFGLEASGLTPLELSGGARFNAPYYAMLRDASHAGVSFATSGGGRLRLGALSANGLRADPLGLIPGERNKLFLSSAEFEQKMGRAVGIVSFGMLRESGSLLGSQQTQALALKTSPTTVFTSVSVGYALSPNSSLVAMASSGRTAGFGNPDSLISQVTGVRTVAYSVGWSRTQLWHPTDRLGLTLSVPVMVRDGTLQLSGPATRLAPNALSYDGRLLNLRPTAVERDLELSYARVLGYQGRQGKLTGALMLRVNPGHDATARPDLLIGVRYSFGF